MQLWKIVILWTVSPGCKFNSVCQSSWHATSERSYCHTKVQIGHHVGKGRNTEGQGNNLHKCWLTAGPFCFPGPICSHCSLPYAPSPITSACHNYEPKLKHQQRSSVVNKSWFSLQENSTKKSNQMFHTSSIMIETDDDSSGSYCLTQWAEFTFQERSLTACQCLLSKQQSACSAWYILHFEL